jgi:hypothetical protein
LSFLSRKILYCAVFDLIIAKNCPGQPIIQDFGNMSRLNQALFIPGDSGIFGVEVIGKDSM